MSYDLTIRPDETFTQFKPLASVTSFLLAQPHVKPTGNRTFVLEDDHRWMEIDLETVSEDGDNLEDESTDLETFNCIRAHIPYASLGQQPELDYFPLLRSIAHQLRWELHNEQSADEHHAGQMASAKPWWKFW